MFLSPEQAPLMGKEYSESTAAKLDAEVKDILESARGRVRGILEEHKDKLEAVAQKLLKTEVMDSAEFEGFLGGEKASTKA
jgi:cell division protease FtsH